jgi:hypothetical protein
MGNSSLCILSAVNPPSSPNENGTNDDPEHYQNHVRTAYQKVFKHLSSQKLNQTRLKKKASKGKIGKFPQILPFSHYA